MNELENEQKISLLTAYLSILPPRWSSQQNYIAMYLTIVLAIFGFAATQAAELLNQDLESLLCAPLLLAALISWFARRSIMKQEKHIRELIVVTAKLEHSLGLYNKLTSPDEHVPWPEDQHMLPAAWISSRLKSGNFSNKFVQQEIGGTSAIAMNIFLLFAISAIVLAVLAVFAQFGYVPKTP